MTNEDNLKIIISEELAGISKSLFGANKTVPGTIIVKRSGKQLVSVEEIEAAEALPEKLADTLLDPKDFLKISNNLYYDIVRMCEQVEYRLGPEYKLLMFNALHEAKNKIKFLRENKEQELSSLKHIIISKYIDIINEHLKDITIAENHIKLTFSEIEDMKNMKGYEISKYILSQYKSMRSSLIKEHNHEILRNFDTEISLLLYRAFKICEINSRLYI
jgi:hypothetical protein